MARLSAGAVNAVNACFAYSRGQPALAACTDCVDSAMPFPVCVFLPDYWRFACASCIARGRAVKCSFYIYRNEFRDLDWNAAEVEVAGNIANWLERGHPLSSFQGASRQRVWVHRRTGSGPAHDLAHPLQELGFPTIPDVPPPDVPGTTRGVRAPSVRPIRRTVTRTQYPSRRSQRIAGNSSLQGQGKIPRYTLRHHVNHKIQDGKGCPGKLRK